MVCKLRPIEGRETGDNKVICMIDEAVTNRGWLQIVRLDLPARQPD
jgi:hypothetical protein